ncbi:MAG TPA: PQQ-binding-like beta-propeller repeat protein [Planctomycetota bacterium]|nr:PQQ-binding-like beta-propeller repeat protein [Planctomycetota bacterium]
MKRRLTTMLVLSSLLLAGGLVRGDDKKKKEKEKETQDSPIESSEARAVMDRVVKNMREEKWADAVSASRELLDKYRDELLLVDEAKEPENKSFLGLHGTVGQVLRRKLAVLPEAGRTVLAASFSNLDAQRLDDARRQGDVSTLLDIGNRYFPLDEGAAALLAAGDVQLEKGCIVGAFQAWKDVFELHTDTPSRVRAAKRLLALLPLVGDAATASDLASIFRKSHIEGSDDLEAQADQIAGQLADKADEDFSVDASGALAPIYSATPPSGVPTKTDSLGSSDVRGIDWRMEQTTQNQWGQDIQTVRRLLFGHYATEDYLIVHCGKSIYAYDTDTGHLVWVHGPRQIKSYLAELTNQGVLARYGICVKGKSVFATLRATPLDEQTPRGKLVRFYLETGAGDDNEKAIWDTTDDDPKDQDLPPKKKKEKEAAAAQEERRPVRLSYCGTPVHAGSRIFCGAYDALSTNDTYIVALDPGDGKVLWKRLLATGSPITQQNPWDASYPQILPAPSIALTKGSLVVLSNNGCVEALDPTDGRVLWAHSYEREEVKQNRWGQQPQDLLSVINRGYNPPLPLGDAVLALPTDSQKMTLLRLTDGTVQGGTRSHTRKGYDYILGVQGGKVVLAGKDVSMYSVKRDGRKVTLETDGNNAVFKDKEIVGRGVLVNGWVYVPTQSSIKGVRVKDAKKKSIVEYSDLDDEKKDKDKKSKEMGDLVVGGGRFFSVGVKTAHIYGKEDE